MECDRLAGELMAAAAALLLLAHCTHAQLAKVHWEDKYFSATREVRLGDPASRLVSKLEPPWVRVGTNMFSTSYPFREWIAYTNTTTILEWRSAEDTSTGWPLVLFAVFSDPMKTNLIDALLYSGTPGVQPLVEGGYNKSIAAIRKGDSMEKVFRLLGTRQCEYYRGPDGKWLVKTVYKTKKGEFVVIQADAASGIVIKVITSGI